MSLDRKDRNNELECLNPKPSSFSDPPKYMEFSGKILKSRYFPYFFVILAFAIMTIIGMIAQQSLASENQKLKAELEELKKSFATYMAKNGQALEELRSADKYLEIHLEKSNQSFETQMMNHEQAIEELRSKNQNLETRLNSLSENIKKDEEKQEKQQGQLDELQSYTKSELTRVAHHESGRASLHYTHPEPINGGPERRCERRVIKFEKPFSSVPKVLVSLSLIGSSNRANTRIVAQADNITTDGFELAGCTWDDSIVIDQHVDWFAYEN